MSRLPALHQQLVRAAHEQEGREREIGALRTSARRLQLLALSFAGVVLASTTIALAATGVIPIGSPAPANHHLRPGLGLGLPEPGRSRLLPLRVRDPEGGPPWGMRIIRTSREEVCLQVGRVENGELGVLGVDGAFKDDGEFHPLPLDSLPSQRPEIVGSSVDTTTSCFLPGQAFIGSHLAMHVSAAEESLAGRPQTAPRRDLRDVYYGLLGPQAVSVSYEQDGSHRTQAVLAGAGIYLIVRPFNGAGLETGGSSAGPLGQLAPGGSGELLTRITYRLNGRLCERGPLNRPAHLAHPCPQSAGPSHRELARLREHPFLHRPKHPDLHRHVHVGLRIHDGLVTAADVSFRAPYAIENARHYYSIFLPHPECHPRPGVPHTEGGVGIAIDHNVAAGQIVSARVTYPFAPVRRPCLQGVTTIEAVYQPTEGLPRTIVGKVTIHQPPGTRGGPHAKPLP
jgi:hypothetical protein